MSIVVVAVIIVVVIAVIGLALAGAPAVDVLTDIIGTTQRLPWRDWLHPLHNGLNEYLPISEAGRVMGAMLSLAAGVVAVRIVIWLFHQFWGSD